ncbi:hypothetical protein Snoj_25500 [Streptomyces nojiriensis]|uniref:Transposase n=1 Tax=Streptomyces nojiriensis TaxID=66374 RepID=A0ABQ3SKT0_9ACTN|nr:hypothetical protein [Streptomyces nojiriensis]QTI50226.1 hypothetical protein JYK04_08102 [Streptomyces nojiriensis]GGS29225.1 hypothetical protein GCM10010205_69080 [Streptomyces nojiriensis]GHI68632.1 hypothetical protein Snoj_25500 [Streptomyces nojiriensis]
MSSWPEPARTAPACDRPPYEADVDLTVPPLADWSAHLSVVRDKAVPLPELLTAVLVAMAEPLNANVADALLAALRAAGVLDEVRLYAASRARSGCLAGC